MSFAPVSQIRHSSVIAQCHMRELVSVIGIRELRSGVNDSALRSLLLTPPRLEAASPRVDVARPRATSTRLSPVGTEPLDSQGPSLYISS